MTIYQIKRNLEAAGNPCFSRDTLKFFNQTMKHFSTKKRKDGKIEIHTKPTLWKFLGEGKMMETPVKIYDPVTNKIEA